jgi:L-seryl-tRNA(Ser) seleniumtransferase
MSHAEGDGNSFIIRPVAMQPGQYKLVAARLTDVLRSAPEAGPGESGPAVDVSGNWRVTVEFVRGAAEHKLELTCASGSVQGTHHGTARKTEIRGTITGNRITLRSAMPSVGSRLPYHFIGTAEQERMSGELNLGEYGKARWSAVKV